MILSSLVLNRGLISSIPQSKPTYAFLHQNNTKSQLVILENMNHVLKNIIKDEENMLSYTSKDFKIHEKLTTTIIKFITELK